MLSSNPNITIKLLKNIQRNLGCGMDVWNPNVTVVLEKHLKTLELGLDIWESKRNWKLLKSIQRNLGFGIMSSNPNITVEFIEKYIDKINFGRLSQNSLLLNTRIKKKEDTCY